MTQKERMKLVMQYQSKLHNYATKRIHSEVVYDTKATSSYYSESKNQIVLNNKSDRSFSHELGHELFHKFSSESFVDIFSLCAEQGIEDYADAEYFLCILKEEHRVSKYSLTPLSDLLGMMFNYVFNEFLCHDAGYIYKFSNPVRIFSDEFVANTICLLWTGDFNGIKILLEYMPKEFYKCLDIIDRALREVIIKE